MKDPRVWLAALSLFTTIFAGYVGLRLEPVYIRVEKLEKTQNQMIDEARGFTNDYIAFKAQTIEILRMQNDQLDRLEEEVRRGATR